MTDPTTAADAGRPSFHVQARGPLSAALLAAVGASPAHDDATTRLRDLERALPEALQTDDAVRDEDLQLTLFLLYAIGYGSFDQAGVEWEWHPTLIATRTAIETVFEDHVRRLVGPVAAPAPRRDEIAAALFEMTAPTPGPSLARFVARKADAEQARELLVQRSIYTLREADATPGRSRG